MSAQDATFLHVKVTSPLCTSGAEHLRRAAALAFEQLRTMAARIFSQHLDRARPLWKIWMASRASSTAAGNGLEGPPLHGRRRRGHPI